MKKIVLAITGSSGAPIGVRLLRELLKMTDVAVSLVMSAHALQTIKLECALDLGATFDEMSFRMTSQFDINDRFRLYNESDMAAPISSGSHLTDAMIIAPCSMSSLAAIRSGMTMNLIHRAASVMMKERRALILVPRESPLSPIHLENMLRLSEIGVRIVPATTAFYTRPRTVSEMVDFIAARVLDQAGLRHELSRRWSEGNEIYENHSRI